jgi:hypothetical protein
LLRQKLLENPQQGEDCMMVIDVPPVLRPWSGEPYPEDMCPPRHLRPAQRIRGRKGTPWRRAERNKGSTVEEETGLQEFRQLLRGARGEDVRIADESPSGFYRWARRGLEGIQIPTLRNENPAKGARAMCGSPD